MLFIERFSGASSAEPEPVDPHGSMETLALSSLHPPLPGTPLDRRELPEPTVEMDTLGSDLSRWGWLLPCDCVLPFTAGEMGIISNSLFRMASACDEELLDDDEDECDLWDDGCLSAMRLAMP